MTKKIGITFSTFDLLHAGHVKMLEEAKTQCDYLIVMLWEGAFFSARSNEGSSCKPTIR